MIRHLFPRHMPLKTWIVFYIKGSKSQQHLGLIYAHSDRGGTGDVSHLQGNHPV